MSDEPPARRHYVGTGAKSKMSDPELQSYTHDEWVDIALRAVYGCGYKDEREQLFANDMLVLLEQMGQRRPSVRQAAWLLDIYRRRKVG